jgi:hypothetical protein
MTSESNVWPCCQQPFGDTTTSCTVDEVDIPGVEHNETLPSVRYDPDYGGVDLRCHDCHITRGSLHHPGCDMERCPKCGGQLIGCGCLSDEAYNAWQRACADLATANATIAAHETDLAATAELLLREQALAESRSLALATLKDLLRESFDHETPTSGFRRVQVLQALKDFALAESADTTAALAGAVLEAADAIVETIVAEGNCKTARDLYRVAKEQEHALDAYRRARAALRGNGAVEG